MERMSMKKFFVPLFLVSLLSCSSEGFKSEIAADAQKSDYCMVDGKSSNISKNLCEEIGGIKGSPNNVSSSSGDAAVSSSSGDDVSSSSRNTISSSSRNAVSSSSGGTAVSSSSGGVAVSSSSGDVVSSSSSGAAVSSSSIVNPSSSSGGAVSSSSIDSPSSSSEPLPEPAWSECSIPQYVGRNEPIANLKFVSIENNNGRCGAITYRLNNTGQGQPVTNLNYSSSSIGTNQTLNITATTTCSGGITLSPKSCSRVVTVADYVKFLEANKDTVLKAGKTIVEVGGVPVNANVFGCQALDNSGSPNPFERLTSFILNGITASVTDNPWWVKTAITSNRMLFESNNAGVGSYKCQIE